MRGRFAALQLHQESQAHTGGPCQLGSGRGAQIAPERRGRLGPGAEWGVMVVKFPIGNFSRYFLQGPG